MLSKIPLAFPLYDAAPWMQTVLPCKPNPIASNLGTKTQLPKPNRIAETIRSIEEVSRSYLQLNLSTNLTTRKMSLTKGTPEEKGRDLVTSSFTGDCVNPITDARLQMSLTSQALAKRLGVSRQYISRAEAGTYTSLNPALLKWVGNALLIGTGDVTKLYNRFQWATRRATVEKVAPHPLQRVTGNQEPGHVLFERWRSGYWNSNVAFSNAFCIHPDTVGRYEEGISREMPLIIRETLNHFDLLGDHFDLKSAPTPRPQALL